MTPYLFVVVAFVCLGAAEPGKILMVPANCNSHVNYFARLGEGLAREGHDVTMIAHSVARVPEWAKTGSMETIIFPVPSNESFLSSRRASELIVDSAFQESIFSRMASLHHFDLELRAVWDKECDALHANTELFQKLREKNFDLAIVDINGLGCELSVPYALDIPTAFFSIFQLGSEYRVPSLPSFTPSLLTEFSDVMTFTERLQNVVAEYFLSVMSLGDDLIDMNRKYAPHRPALSKQEMMKDFKLWFTLYDIATNYPHPLMPNTIPIGDILITEPKPLPKKINQFVQGADNGVVIVSFGSFLDYMPEEVIAKLCTAFKSIPQRVVWKLRVTSLCDVKDKILPLNWLPQNDLLGHPKVILFITHCGLSSIVESVNHGKPMIAMPIGLDQPFNAALVAARKYGVRMSITNFTPEELAENIQHVIGNDVIQKSVRQASEILTQKPDTASQRASFWIDHYLKYGDAFLKSGAFNLSIFEFFMIDIFLFVIAILTILAAIFFFITYCCCRFVTAKICGTKKLKTQ